MKLVNTIVTASLILAGALAGCGSSQGTAATTAGSGGHAATSGGAHGGTGGQGGGALPVTGAELAGEWVSAACEAYDDGKGGKSYLTRDFTLTASSWHLDLGLYGDEKCTVPLFSSSIDGPYTLGARSATVAGATEAEFAFTKTTWTAHAQAMADLFTMSKCGSAAWQVEVPEDVTQSGCIGVAHPLAQCPREYDLVSVQGQDLFFGERITNLCDPAGRPKALAQFPVVKK